MICFVMSSVKVYSVSLWMEMLAIATLLCHGITREDKRQEASALLALPINYAIRCLEHQDVCDAELSRACRLQHATPFSGTIMEL
jgi:hypothetical protein